MGNFYPFPLLLPMVILVWKKKKLWQIINLIMKRKVQHSWRGNSEGRPASRFHLQLRPQELTNPRLHIWFQAKLSPTFGELTTS